MAQLHFKREQIVIGATYGRFSSDNQREESLEDQINVCMKYAEENNIIINQEHVYTDAATSGSLRDRDSLSQLLQAARAKEFEVVIVDDFSRLSRNLIQTLTIIQELSYLGVSLISVQDNVDTSNEDSKINYQIQAMFNERYIDDLRKKTIRGQLGQKQRGFFLAEACFGYKTVPKGKIIKDKKGRSRPEGYDMIIVPHEATVVVRIFQMFNNKKSVSRIVNILNAEGVPSSKFEEHAWNVSTVNRILQNAKYIGKWTWGKLENRRDPSTGIIRQVPRKDGPLHEATHEGLRIVSKELWEQVQARRKEIENRGSTTKGMKGFLPKQGSYVNGYPKELLSGAMICSLCGSKIGKVSGKGGGYYGCMKATRSACSNKIKVRKNIAENLILSEVGKILTNTDAIKYVLSKVEEFGDKMLSTVPEEIRNINTELREKQRIVKNLASFISDGHSSKTIAELLSVAEQRIETLQAELRILEKTKKDTFKAPQIELIEGAIAHVKEILEKQTEQSAFLLRKLLGQISLQPVVPDTGKPYLLAVSNLQPLALFEEKRPHQGPLSVEPDSALDAGANSFHWWRWRESNPRPKIFHVKRLHA